MEISLIENKRACLHYDQMSSSQSENSCLISIEPKCISYQGTCYHADKCLPMFNTLWDSSHDFQKKLEIKLSVRRQEPRTPPATNETDNEFSGVTAYTSLQFQITSQGHLNGLDVINDCLNSKESPLNAKLSVTLTGFGPINHEPCDELNDDALQIYRIVPTKAQTRKQDMSLRSGVLANFFDLPFYWHEKWTKGKLFTGMLSVCLILSDQAISKMLRIQNQRKFGSGPLSLSLRNNITKMDCKLDSIDGKEIKCHSFVFRERSPVFDAMFSGEFKEGISKHVKVAADAATIEALLDFIYNWKIDVPTENANIALELLKLGDFYNISDLVEQMQNIFLSNNFTWAPLDLALSLFEFADLKNSQCTSNTQAESIGSANEGWKWLIYKTIVGIKLEIRQSSTQMGMDILDKIENSSKTLYRRIMMRLCDV